MAGVEPYAPCPCGSGQKYKWCCQKAESFVDRSQRLVETGQFEGAIKILDEGLRKEPGNPWLLMRKAIIQLRAGQTEAAKANFRQILARQPKNFGAMVLLTRCVLETEGPVNGAGMFQQVLSSVEEDQRPNLAPLGRVVGYLLGEYRRFPAALKHLEFVEGLGDPDGSIASARASLMANPVLSPYLKDDYELAEAPDHLSDEEFQRFEQALDWAETGHWAPAAASFDTLSGNDHGGEADYNLGLCRLWLGDEIGAVGPLRRRSRRLGDSVEAVDLEALCQTIEPTHPDDRVELVQLLWPLRDRVGLLANLHASRDVYHEGTASIKPDDPEGSESENFTLLDRPQLPDQTGKGLTQDQIPIILCRIYVGQQYAALESYDDGRVDGLGDRFTALAGKTIAPAHPRTKVMGEVSRSSLALAWDWLFPEEIEQAEVNRLELEKQAQVTREVWPETPMPYLGFRTPLKAARDGNAVTSLRAALCILEQDLAAIDSASLRSRLNVPQEPTIDPKTVDVDHLSLSRFQAIPVQELDDDRLVIFHHRARAAMKMGPMEAASLEIVNRPRLFEQGTIDSVMVFSDLASLAAGREQFDDCLGWLDRGRQSDTASSRGPNAVRWDLVEVRLKARYSTPAVWVPELAIILDRYSQNPAANQVVLMNLVEMGLIRVEPNPDNPEAMYLDSRPLQAVLAEYGPRITTASGRLGVSATRPDLWTPGSAAQTAGGGLWTPGSQTNPGGEPGGDKPKLILPGR